MYHPSLEEVKQMVGKGNLVPVYRSINGDLETPVSTYLKVSRPPYSFLLESVSGGERIGRYSFIGISLQNIVLVESYIRESCTLSIKTLLQCKARSGSI